MPSLAQQLKEYNKTQRHQVSRDVVKTMTLEELATDKITFGESKKGMTYAKALEDTQWTEFILHRFENSDKPEHMMFVQYVRLRLQGVKKDVKDPKVTKDMPPVPQDVWEELMPTDGSAAEDVMNLPFVKEEMKDLRQSNKQLSNRIGQTEMLMTELLEHMRRMEVKTES